ncbi:MAG TPA: hypothetical protein VFR68_13385, partial [Candidatus Dormibacteraeota bacterium]|nr:hypothetical protein [Candidatus Dormibacteraeota bacterium]
MEAAFLPPLGARARSSRFARLRLLLALLAASAFVGTLFFAWLWLQALEEQRSYQSAAICTAND